MLFFSYLCDSKNQFVSKQRLTFPWTSQWTHHSIHKLSACCLPCRRMNTCRNCTWLCPRSPGRTSWGRADTGTSWYSNIPACMTSSPGLKKEIVFIEKNLVEIMLLMWENSCYPTSDLLLIIICYRY